MSNAGGSATEATPASHGLYLLFGFRGRIGRGPYWLGLGAVLVFTLLALILAGEAMSTTGGDSSVLLAIPLALLIVWIHAAITVKRLRDAGFAAWSYLPFITAPLIVIGIAVEFIEEAGLLILIAAAGVLVTPGLLRSRPQTTSS